MHVTTAWYLFTDTNEWWFLGVGSLRYLDLRYGAPSFFRAWNNRSLLTARTEPTECMLEAKILDDQFCCWQKDREYETENTQKHFYKIRLTGYRK